MSYGLVKQLQMKANPSKANARKASVNSSVDDPGVELNADIGVITIGQICQALDVSRSGYYAHQAVHSKRLAEPTVCAQSVHLKAAFAASQKAYGSRRMRTAMAERGLVMGRHRVRTLMRLSGLRPVWRRNSISKSLM